MILLDFLFQAIAIVIQGCLLNKKQLKPELPQDLVVING